MKKHTVLLLAIFVIIALIIILINMIPNDTYEYGEKELKILFMEKNNEDIVKFVCDDFDMDGNMEAFVITGTEEYSGHFAGSLWYISASEYVFVMSNNEDNFAGISIIQNSSSKHFIVNCTNQWTAYSTAYIWEIKSGRPEIILSLDNCYLNIIDDELIAIRTKVGKIHDKALGMSGRVWCTYYINWDVEEKQYQECVAKNISSEEFFSYKNAAESIGIVEEELEKKIKEELHDSLTKDYNVERAFIIRQNGIININYTVSIDNSESDIDGLFYHAVLKLNNEDIISIYKKEADGYLQGGIIDNIGFDKFGKDTYTITHVKDGSTYSVVFSVESDYNIRLFDSEANMVQSIFPENDIIVNIEFLDVNSDGYTDIVLNTGGTWNETHDLYIWDISSCNFIKVIYEGFEILAWFEVRDGYIENFIRGDSPDDSIMEKLVWDGNVLIKMHK